MAQKLMMGIPDWVADLIGRPKEEILSVNLRFEHDSWTVADIRTIPMTDADPPDGVLARYNMIRIPDDGNPAS